MNIELDTDWIENFNQYETFYKQDIDDIQISYIYIDKNSNVIKTRKEIYELNKTNILSKEELIYLIHHHKNIKNEKYSLLSLLQYNVDIEPDEIIMNKYETKNQMNEKNIDISNNKKEDILSNYLTTLYSLDTIYWKPTINFFKDINTLYIVYHEKRKKKERNKTKRVYISTTKTKHKKTRRNI